MTTPRPLVALHTAPDALHPHGRRDFLRGVAFAAAGVSSFALLSGCGAATETVDDSTDRDEAELGSCSLTAANIEGPFYRAGSPTRSNLVTPAMRGTLLTLTGRVYGKATTCKPIAGASLDVWQANAEGAYDQDDKGKILVGNLRGRMQTQSDGTYAIDTIVPGHYLNGAQYRPAHIHVKVSAPGYQPLTTQLYFQGDPYNAIDPFIDKSLIMKVRTSAGKKSCQFNFGLKPA